LVSNSILLIFLCFPSYFLQVEKAGFYYNSSPHLYSSSGHPIEKFTKRFQEKLTLWKDTDHPNDANPLFPLSFEDILAILQIKPKMFDSFSSMSSASPTSGGYNNNKQIVYLPGIHLQWLQSPQEYYPQLFATLRGYCESLFGDVINLGTMLGYPLTQNSVEQNVHILQTILELGLSYSCSENEKLISLLPIHRALIYLQPKNAILSEKKSWKEAMPEILHKSFMKRVKDLKRIFKNKVSTLTTPGKLTFSINTNFAHCLAKLREYHGTDNWVNESLEKVWFEMMTKKQTFFIFELWYGEDLLAADFAHFISNGKFCYVATRYSNRAECYKTIPSGFLLAVLECGYLYQHNVLLWDLGGVNHCPLMRYKYELIGEEPEERPIILEWFHERSSHWTTAQKESNSSNGSVEMEIDYPTGIIIEDIKIDDIL
jgi:hypothetical protein